MAALAVEGQGLQRPPGGVSGNVRSPKESGALYDIVSSESAPLAIFQIMFTGVCFLFDNPYGIIQKQFCKFTPKNIHFAIFVGNLLAENNNLINHCNIILLG